MSITIQDVRREVLTGISRIRIIDSDTIVVADGDHVMQPSVIGGTVPKESHIDMLALATEHAFS